MPSTPSSSDTLLPAATVKGANLTHPASQSQTVHLSRGELALTYQVNGHYHLEDLLGFAERINPKRAFLFVSQVLGRHIPVEPSRMRQAFSDLADLIPDGLPEPIVVVGMAETAVGLSAGVHQRLQTRATRQPYPNAILLNSTRHAQPAQLFTTFSEDHSHASQHLVYLTQPSVAALSTDPLSEGTSDVLAQQVLAAKTLIMVDDEASTGHTCRNLVAALRNAGMQDLTQVHLVTLVDWSLDRAQEQPFDDIAFFRHHLLSGQWQWTDGPNPPVVNMPNVATTAAGSQPLLPTGNWGRLPTQHSASGLPILLASLQQQFAKRALTPSFLSDKKILVLGSNEFVWLPFLLAEHLQNTLAAQVSPTLPAGVVKFSALTRSPIAVHPQSAITSCLTFQDNYGLGMTNFVYNVVMSEWDLIVLCIETAAESVDPFWQQHPHVLVVAPVPYPPSP